MKKNKFKKEEKARLYLEKLEERLKYYRQVVIDSNDAVIIQDFKGTIKAWNKGAERIYGFSEREMLGKNIIKIIAKIDRAEARKNIFSIKQGKPTFRIRQTRIAKDGGRVLVAITYSPIYEKEELIEIATTEEDIGELKKIKINLEKSQKVAKIGSWDLDITNNILRWSQEAYNIFDIKLGTKLTYEKFLSFVHPDDRKYVDKNWKKALRGESYDIEHRVLINGQIKWVREKANIEFVNKKAVTATGIVQDITENKKQIQQIMESEEKYRAFIEASPDCVKLFDLKGKLFYINKGGLKEHRIKSLKEALRIGWRAIESVVPRDRIKFAQALRDAKNGKTSVIEMEHTKKDSVREFCEETIVPIMSSHNKIVNILGVSRDISVRKRAEEGLKKQEEAILNIMDDLEKEKEKAEKYLRIAGSLIFTLNNKGDITMINAKGNEILGYKNGDLIGKNWFNTCLPKENIEEVKGVFAKLMVGDVESVETHENNIIRKDGEKRMIEWHNSLLKDNRGNITGILSSGVDITERVEIDKAKTEFVSLASHQLRTPLSAISWYTEMLAGGDLGALSEDQKKYIYKIYKSNRRMADLVSALLNVSRLELGTFVIEPELTDIRDIANSVIEELEPEKRRRNIKFKETFSNNLFKKIELDIKLTRIIIQNLLSNAVKYTPKGGKVGIDISKKDNKIKIVVSDNGYGIPKDQQKQLFTKLFRADNIKQKDTDGTGLGLYLVKSILGYLNGNISFKSAENKGSVFTVTMPVPHKIRKGTKRLE